MGACSFFERVTSSQTPQECFENLCREAENYYGHQEGYNGTISTTDLIKIVKYADRYTPAVEKRFEKEEEKFLDKMGKRDCWCIDLGVVEYQAVSFSKQTYSKEPPKYAMKYVVYEYDGNGRKRNLKNFDTKKAADDYALSVLRMSPQKELEVYKEPVKISGNACTTSFKMTTRAYKSKPKNVPKGCILTEKHKYVFIGWAAE